MLKLRSVESEKGVRAVFFWDAFWRTSRAESLEASVQNLKGGGEESVESSVPL